ncbi:polymer-forming cytoskeletal protein [Bacillus sp. FJAT-49736]|uniref:polymer-forming cytoskeletal protein n=1 Tax=Bacillus sp. FJAT-49736 TaxID=2833582 RepID=UPI001BC8DAB3|nr:polymer-forming cytoskeletal protein [Bacillus sp. FJAT-49736]MBS4175455.1 polymer-forming cytoskeletal protein [Bacillus sp. FJAT-49736]
MMNKSRDLIINGFGSSNGGEFDLASINGKGKVLGDLSCKHYDCNGFGTVDGNINAETIKINGNSKVIGNVEAENITIDGHSSMSGEVNTDSIRISGSGTIGGSLRGEHIKINGKASIGGDCEAEEFVSEGIFTIGGLLNAETIDILLYGDCKAKEIGGQDIRIKQRNQGFMKIIKSIYPTRLVTDVIEGDDIYIEGVKAKIVRGNNVTIGQNCDIDLLEYKEKIEVDKSSKVRNSNKI